MAKKRKKPHPAPDPFLDEIDRFLEDGIDAVSPAVRRQLEELPEEEKPSSSSEPEASPVEKESKQSRKRVPATSDPTKLELVLIEDGLKAVVRTVHPRTGATDILDLLDRNGISHGVDKVAILQAVETARKTGQPLSDVVVALGKPPQPPPPPRIEYCIPEGLESLPSLEPVRKLLALKDREEIVREAASLQAWAVGPGDRLATRIAPRGKDGLDVEGQPIPAPEETAEKAVDRRLQPGQGVQLAPNGVDYLASAYGYAGLENSQVTVLDPLWIAPDGMQACFLRLPTVTGSTAPSSDDLRALLKAFGVDFGIDEQMCNLLRQDFARLQKPLIALARGEQAQASKDAVPTFALDFEFRIGSFRPDGSIDFRERNLFPPVRQDDLLAECPPPVPGKPGRTVRGEELPATEPVGARLVAGENVRLEEEDGQQRLYATDKGGAVLKTEEINLPRGGLQLRQYTIEVQQVTRIEGDVGYDTGNVDVQGLVEIGGSVNGGFFVRTTGDVAIAGSVETGAEIQAGGDIVVKQGIVGRQTSVTAGSSVSAKFVHDARVKAGTDVLIGSYIYGAHLQAGGRVQVEGLGGKENAGGIIGGTTWAIKGILSRNIGSERSTNTALFVGLEPDQRARFQKIGQTIRQAELMLQKLLKAIELPALKADEIRKLVARNPARRSTLLHYIKKANQLAQVREKHVREQQELAEQISVHAREASIDVPEQAFARTALHIGSLQLVLTQDLQRVRFVIDPETERIDGQDLP